MQSNQGVRQHPAGRRAVLATAGCGAVALAGMGWAAVDPLKASARTALEEMLQLTPPRPVLAPPLPPRRVTHPAVYPAEAIAEWGEFKRRYVSPDGRVIDTGNGGVSHTEGQGWGMLGAVAFDDVATFESLHGWTARTLQRRGDRLHSWRYQPNAHIPVADANNATDGDLFIAQALWRAAWRWGRADWAQAAQAIARDILALLVRETGTRSVLLPGVHGFETSACLTVNPSYYVFPAMEEMAALAPSPVWGRLLADGHAMLAEARFGRWQLPPDWLRMDRETGALAPHPNWPARFSYDAMRVPLWLSWSEQNLQSDLNCFETYWNFYTTFTPAWVNLKTNISANYPAPPGLLAVGQVAVALSRSVAKQHSVITFPLIRSSPNYYSAALTMLSRYAWQECRNM